MSIPTQPAVSYKQQLSNGWSAVANYVGPPIAAGISFFPLYYLFNRKSCQQLGDQMPKMTIKGAVKGGCALAPSAGLMVGSQMACQPFVDKGVNYVLGEKPKESSDIGRMLISSAVTGVISSPFVAGFNGQTIESKEKLSEFQKFRLSVKATNRQQVAAIVAQETIFMASVRGGKLVSNYVKATIGDNWVIKYTSIFLTGVVGAVLNHSANTFFTLSQRKDSKIEEISLKNLNRKTLARLMQGWKPRALAVGAFCVIYDKLQEVIIPHQKENRS